MVKPAGREPGDQKSEPRGETSEERQRLWIIAVSPSLWLAHFLACYLTVAVWCAKVAQPSSLGSVRWAVAAYTALALPGIALTGWLGYRRYRLGAGARLRHRDTPADRQRFLGFASLLLSGLSVVAVLYVALPALFIEDCR